MALPVRELSCERCGELGEDADGLGAGVHDGGFAEGGRAVGGFVEADEEAGADLLEEDVPFVPGDAVAEGRVAVVEVEDVVVPEGGPLVL